LKDTHIGANFLDNLYATRTSADEADSFALGVKPFFGPAGCVHPLSGELIQTFDIWDVGLAGGALEAFRSFRLYMPHVKIVIPVCAFDCAIEQAVLTQTKLLVHVVEVPIRRVLDINIPMHTSE